MDEQINHCHGQSDPNERAANAIREYTLWEFAHRRLQTLVSGAYQGMAATEMREALAALGSKTQKENL
jgi:hypothetical protein